MSLWLRGGTRGHGNPSSYQYLLYKDVVQALPSQQAAQPKVVLAPFLVVRSKEVSILELTHKYLHHLCSRYEEYALIFRFNVLWPKTTDMYDWIHKNGTKDYIVLFYSKGFFIIVLENKEYQQKIISQGTSFWGNVSIFLTPSFLDFNPSTMIITKLSIWVHIPNLPSHIWNFLVFQGIGDT